MAINQMNTILVLRADNSTNWESSTYEFQAGEVGLEFLQDSSNALSGKVKMKACYQTGQTWAEMPYIGGDEAKVLQVDSLDEITETELNPGDTAIVKTTLIENEKYSYTAYVYNGTDWAAMDGNYSAENVYFDEDMLFTYQFGKYKLEDGNVIIPSAGKSLKELLMSAHVDIIDPTSTSPNFSIDATANKNGEVGSTYALPSATATFTDGKYSYGYVDENGNKTTGTNTGAGITASTINISCNKSSDVKNVTNSNSATLNLTTDNLNSGISKNLLFEDSAITYTFSATCTYPSSIRTPINNVGETSNTDTGVEYTPIQGGSWNESNKKTDSCTVTGWRKMFMGTVDSSNTNTTIDSNLIRNTMNKLINEQVSTSAKTFTVPVGATKIIVACPTGYEISKCEYFTMSWEEIALFPHLQENNANKMVPVADYRGGDNGLMDYHVYVFTHSSPSGFEAATQYRVTLKKT